MFECVFSAFSQFGKMTGIDHDYNKCTSIQWWTFSTLFQHYTIQLNKKKLSSTDCVCMWMMKSAEKATRWPRFFIFIKVEHVLPYIIKMHRTLYWRQLENQATSAFRCASHSLFFPRSPFQCCVSIIFVIFIFFVQQDTETIWTIIWFRLVDRTYHHHQIYFSRKCT